MGLDVIKDSLLESPPEEVQLAYCCEEGLMLGNLEENPLPPTKRVEQLLAVRLELVLVIHIDGKLLSAENVRSVVCLAVICYEPVDKPQAYLTGSFEEFDYLVDIGSEAVEPLETRDNEFLLTMNLLLTCLGLGGDFWDVVQSFNRSHKVHVLYCGYACPEFLGLPFVSLFRRQP